MFNFIKTQIAGAAIADWIAEAVRRRALRSKMTRELNSLRSLSDSHLKDIGLYRSEIERYILDLHTADLRRETGPSTKPGPRRYQARTRSS